MKTYWPFCRIKDFLQDVICYYFQMNKSMIIRSGYLKIGWVFGCVLAAPVLFLLGPSGLGYCNSFIRTLSLGYGEYLTMNSVLLP